MKFPAIRTRLVSGLSMGVVAIGAFFYLPDILAPFVVAGLMGFLSLEFYQMIESGGLPNFKWFGTFWAVVLVFVTWFGTGKGMGDSLVLFGATILIFIRLFPQKGNPRPLATVAGTLFGLLYIGLLWNFITKLLMLGGGGGAWGPSGWGVNVGARLLVLYGALTAKFTDVGAYVAGCLWGRHKLMPRISPAKSWEGVFGGVIVGTLTGACFVWGCGGALEVFGLTVWRAVGLGGVLSVCAVMGDLTESMFKRGAGVKDSGGVLPGLGGLLDVFDSLLFVFPGLYLYCWLMG